MDERQLARVLDGLMKPGVDAADMYFQHSATESWLFEDGIVKTGSHHVEQGVGVRAMAGEKTGFAYSDEIALPALTEAAGTANAIVRQGQQASVRAWTPRAAAALYPAGSPLASLPTDAKLALLRRADAAARAADPAVTHVIVSLAGSHDTVLVTASDGTLAADVRPLVRMNVTVIAERNGRREQAAAGGGARRGYDYFLAGDKPEEYAREAVRQALVLLDSVPAPAGTMTVVLGPGWPGVLLHEAVGHGLEGDFNRKGTSAFSGRIGQRVASAGVTVVDDGAMHARRGSLTIDDEGTPTGRTVLIEDGILKTYMQDRLNARLMGMAATGNGRRESFAHAPMPRMTNTFMLAGKDDPGELVGLVKDGVYAKSFGGGQVDITSGKFVLTCTEAYRIRNGRLAEPLKGATLIGDGPSVLTRVKGIGNDLELDEGVGICGKAGQSIPAGVGQPTLLIDGLTVGGTAA